MRSLHQQQHPRQQTRIPLGPRTRVAVAEMIAELQSQRQKIHDPWKRAELDARIKALCDLLTSGEI